MKPTEEGQSLRPIDRKWLMSHYSTQQRSSARSCFAKAIQAQAHRDCALDAFRRKSAALFRCWPAASCCRCLSSRMLRASNRIRDALANSRYATELALPKRGSGGSTGSSSIQSTGQGGIHSSQPVQRLSMTVCISFCAPTIASTGQASIHFAQPMQSFSMITAMRSGSSLP